MVTTQLESRAVVKAVHNVKNDYPPFVVHETEKSRYIFIDSNNYGIVWKNVVAFIILHYLGIWGSVRAYEGGFYATWIFAYFYGFISVLGVTSGAHRLWAHRTYRAKLPYRILAMLLQTAAGQNNIYVWSRDHRLHHKFSESDADPHNSKRGFFFCHMGWLMTKKHPDVMLKGKTIDCSDMLQDPVVRFQIKYYYSMFIVFSIVLPVCVCHCAFGNTWGDAFLIGFAARYLFSLHLTWFVNSAAHMFGHRPYNDKIAPAENVHVCLVGWGSEGFHNFHHTFPWDYAITELGWFINPAKHFIDVGSMLGQVTDLKRASPEIVAATRAKVKARKEPIDPFKEPHEF